MTRPGDDVELAARDSFVQDSSGARGGRTVVLADDHEGRLVDVVQPGAVVESAVAHVREVAEHLGRADTVLEVAGRRLAVEVERQLVAQELFELRLGLDGLLSLPGARDRLAVLAECIERGLDVGFERVARVASRRDDVGGGGPELGGGIGGDDRAERVAEQSEAGELEGLGQQVDVPGEDLERECRGVDPLGAALPALVAAEQAVLVAERVEVRPEHRVVEPRPPMQNDQRKAAADLLYVEVVAVRQHELHAELNSTLLLPSPWRALPVTAAAVGDAADNRESRHGPRKV